MCFFTKNALDLLPTDSSAAPNVILEVNVTVGQALSIE